MQIFMSYGYNSDTVTGGKRMLCTGQTITRRAKVSVGDFKIQIRETVERVG